jgi:hypothetical protein
VPVVGGQEADPFKNDPGRWGASLVTLSEVLFGCLDAARPRSVIEVGAYAGDLTELLLRWAQGADATVTAVDPEPQPELEALAAASPGLELIRKPSLEALSAIEPREAVILDGDHNYYTVSSELALVEKRAGDAGLPLIILHDVAWPHARRDTYYAPEAIPPEGRRPMAEGAHLFPGIEGVHHGGIPYKYAAATEGGERNGVGTAIDDFVAERPELRYALVPAFYGLGVVWRPDAPYAAKLESLLAPWDRNPLLARLEANRVLHIANGIAAKMEANQWHSRADRLEHLLRKMLESKAFSVGERISGMRQGGEPLFSREEIRRALEDDD